MTKNTKKSQGAKTPAKNTKKLNVKKAEEELAKDIEQAEAVALAKDEAAVEKVYEKDNVKTAVLITSLLVNLFFIAAWITLMVLDANGTLCR
jgi:hypothetical protein